VEGGKKKRREGGGEKEEVRERERTDTCTKIFH
jgi:hypothetical protein